MFTLLIGCRGTTLLRPWAFSRRKAVVCSTTSPPPIIEECLTSCNRLFWLLTLQTISGRWRTSQRWHKVQVHCTSFLSGFIGGSRWLYCTPVAIKITTLYLSFTDGYDRSNSTHHKLLCSILMTSCDLCFNTKSWEVSEELSSLLYREFFTQGDLEKALGETPLEMMDKDKAYIPAQQVGFLNGIAGPVYQWVLHAYGLYQGCIYPSLYIYLVRCVYWLFHAYL